MNLPTFLTLLVNVLISKVAVAIPTPDTQDVTTALVGGEDATSLADFPFIVSIRFWRIEPEIGTTPYFQCACAMIGKVHLVTAAFCSLGIPMSSLRVARNSTSVDIDNDAVEVHQILVHLQYDPLTGENDIAIWRIYDNGQEMVRLAGMVNVGDDPADGQSLRVTGWGSRTFLGGENAEPKTVPLLQQITVPVISREKCRQDSERPISDRMFCTGRESDDKGLCSGDGGSPVMNDLGRARRYCFIRARQ